ncbi:MAG TPA: class I SAM-dependent methyltransferase [Dongiaceae bacterium]|nr:class I SAM-dependent methyltransferase [Dongiaceae bacterium]
MKPCNPILREIDYRTEIGAFLDRHGLTNVGVEVGVFLGEGAKLILEGTSVRRLVLVDPYRKFTQAEYFDSTQDRDQDQVFAEAQANLYAYNKRSTFWRMDSLDAAPRFRDGELDFVWLDGNHSYEASSADIAAWYPKVRSGGLFSGHDFYTRLKDTNSDALNAVLDFAERIDTRPHVTWCSSWWFIKS